MLPSVIYNKAMLVDEQEEDLQYVLIPWRRGILYFYQRQGVGNNAVGKEEAVSVIRKMLYCTHGDTAVVPTR